MKKYLLVLIIFFAITCVHGQTNVYHPFPDSNAIWRVNSKLACTIWWFIAAPSYYQYTTGGDTTIGAFTYKKIYQSGTFGHCWGDDSVYYTNHYYYQGGLRQDVDNRKVYFKCPAYPETLIYDFSKQVGDTLRLVECQDRIPYEYTVIIQSIDSVLVGNNYHKQFHLYNSFEGVVHTIIEGVGATSGLFESILNNETNGREWNLVCFSHFGHDTYYYSSDSTSCNLYAGIPEIKQNDNRFKIFPNPFSIQTTFQIDKNLKNATVTIFNSYGQQVKQIKNISGQTINLQRNNLPSGLYFLQLMQDNKILITDKIVITDK